MIKVKRGFLLFAFLWTASPLLAQRNKPAAQKAPATQKFKPPKVKTFLGDRSDSVGVSSEEGSNLVGMSLRIEDDNKVAYSISSYQFLYRKKEITEDEELTGKTSITSSIVAHRFKSTPLPDIWIQNVREQLKPGEELYFFDVVAKDTQGHLFFAPTLKIKIN